MRNLKIASFGALLAATLATASVAQPPAISGKPLMTQPLIGVTGKEVTMTELLLPPGANSPPHRHDANTFVYVLEGTVEMQVAGGPLMKLAAGQTFYESPADVHTVSHNPSTTAPARILVTMVKDVGKPATTPVR